MKNNPPKKTSKKRQPTKKQPSLPRSKKTIAKRIPRSKAKPNKHLNIWLGPSLRLELSLKLTKSKSKKHRKSTKKQPSFKARQRIISSVILITAGLIGSAYFTYSFINPPSPPLVYSPPAPLIEKPLESIKHKSFTRSEPVSLHIPDVGIETSLVFVGQKDDGTMEVPKSYDIAGWYNLSPAPGELGPAIIVGHVDSFRGPAVFWRLSQLIPGQFIEVKRADGITVKFKVDAVKQFDQNNFPSEEVYGNIDYAGLRLITCGGQFNRSTGHYSHNTVVYASISI